jgi:hypothetical protein
VWPAILPVRLPEAVLVTTSTTYMACCLFGKLHSCFLRDCPHCYPWYRSTSLPFPSLLWRLLFKSVFWIVSSSTALFAPQVNLAHYNVCTAKVETLSGSLLQSQHLTVWQHHCIINTSTNRMKEMRFILVVCLAGGGGGGVTLYPTRVKLEQKRGTVPLHYQWW